MSSIERRDRHLHVSAFWRHYLEMLGVMVVGMIAAGAVLVIVTHSETWDDVTVRYPYQALFGIAAGMSVPMAVWMLLRRMGRRNAVEMAAVMVLPAIPFLCLVWFNVTEAAQCGPYCIASIVAMYVLMRYRRDQYSGHAAAAPLSSGIDASAAA